jgi:tetratricopeptide (TPR) repeat protein
VSYLRVGRLEEAIEVLGRQVKADPKAVEAWVGLGWALEHAHRAAEAEAAYRSALRRPRLLLAQLLWRTGRSREAIDGLEPILKNASGARPARRRTRRSAPRNWSCSPGRTPRPMWPTTSPRWERNSTRPGEMAMAAIVEHSARLRAAAVEMLGSAQETQTRRLAGIGRRAGAGRAGDVGAREGLQTASALGRPASGAPSAGQDVLLVVARGGTITDVRSPDGRPL